MQGKTATVIGATGLIGSELVRLLATDNYFTTVRALVRRPVSFSETKIQTKLINFSDHEFFKLAIEGSDAVFCAVGTTQKKVKGDREAYRKVDYDIPVKAAQFCQETQCPKLLIVSSMGANATSNNFYAKLKGEMEQSVQQKTIKYIGIFRPSLLLGDRKEFRLGEKVAKALMEVFSFIIPRKWKAIHATTVAEAMINAAKLEKSGTDIFENAAIKNLATAHPHQAQ